MQVIMWHWNLTFVCGNRLLEWISTIYMHSLLIFPHVFFTLSLSSSLNVSCVCDKKILNKKFSNNIFFKRQLARREGFFNTTEKKNFMTLPKHDSIFLFAFWDTEKCDNLQIITTFQSWHFLFVACAVLTPNIFVNCWR